MAGASVVPAGAWVSENDRLGKVKVTVVANAETQVTVTNQPAAATIKVCKWSASPALQGAQFSFTVNGQTVTGTAGKSAATAGLLDRAHDRAGHEAEDPGERPGGRAGRRRDVQRRRRRGDRAV